MYHSALKIGNKMDIVCFDMEGTLTPEIWEQVASDTGLEELNKTTRDILSYSDLMDYRIEIMRQHNLKLSDVVAATKKLDLLEGALDFLNETRKNFQVVILSDTFHEIAYPLMEKMGYLLMKAENHLFEIRSYMAIMIDKFILGILELWKLI